MKRRSSRSPGALPLIMAELALASWETIAHRSRMMALGACTPAEYRRMAAEKMRAAEASSMALFRRSGSAAAAAMLAPWLSRARSNARRLRRK
jgi:hypothetical protein